MYDNISIYCDSYSLGAKNILRHIIKYGKGYDVEKNGVNKNGVEYAYISLMGENSQKLTFEVTPHYLRLSGKNSSICKFFLGNNFETMSLAQFKLAIEAISMRFGELPIRNGQVQRIDLATNFIMNFAPSVYNSCMVNLSRYGKVTNDGNLYFKTKKIELIFYDKNKEYRDKGYKIPDKFKDVENILRYEIRFKRGLKKVFGKTIKVKDLYNSVFYSSLVGRWKNSFESIFKQNPIVFNSEVKTYSTSDFKNYYMVKGVEASGGINYVYKTIESSKKVGGINKDRASYLRKTMSKAYEVVQSFEGLDYDYVAEVDKKMEEFEPKLE